jgi:hypothetical protein
VKPPKSASDGPITKALLDAVAMRRQLLDNGHDPAEVDRTVGQGLKALLGNPRGEPWKFYCRDCRDTGWVNVVPSPDEQARLEKMYGDTTQQVGYVRKCGPECRWLQLEREKRRKQQGQDFAPDDDLVAAGQIKPKRRFSQVGR